MTTPRLRICKIPGCGETPKIRRGWCPKHYMRWRRYGDPFKARVKYPSECTIAGCGQQHHARGKCYRHYLQARRAGG